MKPNKIILIILTGLLISFFTGCGYTVVKKSSKSSEYTNTQQNYSYTLSGRWTKRVNNIRGGNATYLDYYLNFYSNGIYDFSIRDRISNPSGNYYVESDTLTFVTEYYISKYQFSRDGTDLILNFISFEQRNRSNIRQSRLDGVWRINY
jgi:hypothetical protein